MSGAAAVEVDVGGARVAGPAVRYGAEKTRLFLFFAIDYSCCKKLEDRLRKAGDNETLYVIPLSLQSASDGAAGRQHRSLPAHA